MSDNIQRTDNKLLATYNGHPVPNRCFDDHIRKEANKLVAVSTPCKYLKLDGTCKLQKCNKVF